jgi:hypothetical protein
MCKRQGQCKRGLYGAQQCFVRYRSQTSLAFVGVLGAFVLIELLLEISLSVYGLAKRCHGNFELLAANRCIHRLPVVSLPGKRHQDGRETALVRPSGFLFQAVYDFPCKASTSPKRGIRSGVPFILIEWVFV